MMTINREMGTAMAEAVRRNKKEQSPAQLAADLEKALELVALLREKNRRLEAALAVRASGEIPQIDGGDGWTGETVDGRPVVTVAQAAATCRISRQAAYRRIYSSKWEVTQLSSRDWRVFVDADGFPLMKSSQRE